MKNWPKFIKKKLDFMEYFHKELVALQYAKTNFQT